MVTINVEVIFDPICPWCYIAHRVIEKAIQLHQTKAHGDRFNITFFPYYLLETSAQTRDKKEFYRDRFPERDPKTMFTRVTEIGRDNGISFNFDEGKIGNSKNAHRLILLAQASQKSDVRDKIVHEVMSAFHEKGKDITDWEVLKSIALEAGVSAKEVDKWSNSNFGMDQVDLGLERARKLAGPLSRGVPITIVQGEHRFNGAPNITDLCDAFSDVREGSSTLKGMMKSWKA